VDEVSGDYADQVTLTYAPAVYGGVVVDRDQWVDVDLPGGARWDMTWLHGIIDTSLQESEVPGFNRETRATLTSWGASGAGIEITVALAETAFVSLGAALARRVVAAVRERFRMPVVPTSLDRLVEQARQRVAVRHGVFATDLRVVEQVDGTDVLRVTFAAGDGTLYEVEVDSREPWVQTVRRRTHLATG